ncbi:response regulator [uncultured Spirosoma sp.]|nr:response regulator [uncultured Spirosoma sp.]MBR8840726.1 response regulator [Stigonema ocellatum SAG 48.90 = DSM 106950]
MSLKGPIICIDDDDDDQHLLRHAIEQAGVTNPIRFFANGEDALSYFETTTEQPFLILCDINMPFLNGLELRQRINDSEYLRQKAIPFVFLTTASNAEYVRQAYQESVQGFYEKATNYAQLQQQVRLIIEYWQSCLHPNNVV